MFNLPALPWIQVDLLLDNSKKRPSRTGSEAPTVSPEMAQEEEERLLAAERCYVELRLECNQLTGWFDQFRIWNVSSSSFGPTLAFRRH